MGRMRTFPHSLHGFVPYSSNHHHLDAKKPDVSDIRLFALFQSRSRDAAAVPMAEAFGTGLHTQ